MSKRKIGFVALLASGMLLQACGNQAEKPDTSDGSKNDTPVTLTMTSFNTSTNEAEFKMYMEPFLAKKYPHIQVKWIEPVKGQTLNDLMTAGQTPDIIATGYSHILALLDLDIPLDLNEHIAKTKFDLTKIDPVAVQSVKQYGDKGQTYALPYVNNYFLMVYNKDIFDRFAVPYPKNGMSWEDAIELGKRVTRQDNGIQYRGFLAGTAAHILGRGLSLPLVDPKTDKAQLNTDKWNQVYQTMKTIYTIPGNEDLKASHVNAFLDGTAAMLANWGQATINVIAANEEKGKKLNWDMVTFPFFKETPNKDPEISTNVYVVSKSSKNAAQAFDVISYLSSSVDVQSAEVKAAMRPVVQIDNIKEIFGSNIPALKGKNVEAAFKNAPHSNHPPSRYDTIAQAAINKYFAPFHAGEIDVREALSKAEEEANRNISAERAKFDAAANKK